MIQKSKFFHPNGKKLIYSSCTDNIILAGIVILSLILRLINLGQSFWLDEAAQVLESSRKFLEQFNLAADFHPPLYHVILHFWMQLQTTEVWIRLISVMFGIGSIIAIYGVGKVLKKRKEGLLAALFLAISPYHIWYSQETRPYMLFTFISLLSSYFLIKKIWFWYILTIVFSLYSLYFAPFLILSHFIYLFLYGKKDLWIFKRGILTALFFFLPWIPEFFLQIKTGTNGFFSGWTNIVSVSPLRAVPLTFSKFILGHGTFHNKLLYGLILFPIISLFFISLVKEYGRKDLRLAVLFLTPLVSSVIVSFFIPVLAPQRLLFILPIFFLLIAEVILNLSKRLKILCFMLVLITSSIGITQYYLDPHTQREQWRQAVFFTEEKNNGNAMAIFVFPDPFAPYLWYQKNQVKAIGIAPEFLLKDKDLHVLSSKLDKINKIYLYQYLTGLTDSQNKAQKFLRSKGYTLSKTADFPGVGFIYIYDQ